MGSSEQAGLGEAAQDIEWGREWQHYELLCPRRQVASPLWTSVSTSVKEGRMWALPASMAVFCEHECNGENTLQAQCQM